MKTSPKAVSIYTSIYILCIILCIYSAGCINKSQAAPETIATVDSSVSKTEVATDTILSSVVNDAATILSIKEVPILCYHQVRDWRPTDSKTAKAYIVPENTFREQIKMLADSGYNTILPDQLFDYLTRGGKLPPKPIMLTFDDTDLDQYTVAYPEMKKYNYKGVFFVMTVSLGRPNYMSKDQVKDLSDAGNVIGSHTWDHHNVKKYTGNDWVTQIEKPSKQLETITGKKIDYFAYPFGLWNKEAIPELQKRGFKAAFQLYAKRDQQDPLFTIQRIIVPGSWGAAQLDKAIKASF